MFKKKKKEGKSVCNFLLFANKPIEFIYHGKCKYAARPAPAIHLPHKIPHLECFHVTSISILCLPKSIAFTPIHSLLRPSRDYYCNRYTYFRLQLSITQTSPFLKTEIPGKSGAGIPHLLSTLLHYA